MAEGVTFEDLPDRSGKIRKTANTDYAKLAKAIGDIRSRGINVSLVDINNSSYSFKPSVGTNEILFGLKGLNKVGEPVIKQIIEGRPYKSIVDFMNRCPLNKTVMISLIKAGAFDNIDGGWASQICNEPRKAIMAYYLSKNCDAKKKITLQNFNGLLQRGLIPDFLTFQRQVFNFNNYLKKYLKDGEDYILNEKAYAFYEKYFDLDVLNIIGGIRIAQKDWKKMYDIVMDEAKEWLKNNQKEVLNSYNAILFKEVWDKYAAGTISAWEMESLCFYYHEHELAKVNAEKYGIVNFKDLPSNPEVEYFFKRKGKDIPIYVTHKIMGTVIGKNDARSSVSLLTLDGVVNVKFTKEYFAMFNRQLSEVQEDGKKKVVEKGWFSRGTMIMVTGFRRDDTFQAKSYKHTPTHQLYKIIDINGKEMTLEHERYNVE